MNNDINEKIVHAAPVPPFVRFVASAVPMVFDNSLSYYEALCALWKWMQDDVIDVINNNATVTEHYIELDEETRQLFIELKSYVDNYFDNLDVQDEINNKLDQMAEDGTLENIMSNYLVIAGVNAKFLGCAGDGVTDDTAAINSAISSAVSSGIRKLVFPEGEYVISGAISVPSNFELLGMKGSVLKYVGNGTSGNIIELIGSDAEDFIENVTIDNITIDGSNQIYKGGYSMATPAVTHTNPLYKGLTCVRADFVANIVIKNCHFNDVYGDGIIVRYGYNVRIVNNTLNDVSSGNIQTDGQSGYDDHGDAIAAFFSFNVNMESNSVVNTRTYLDGMSTAIGKPCGRSGLEFEYALNQDARSSDNPSDPTKNPPYYTLIPTTSLSDEEVRWSEGNIMNNNYVYGYTKGIHLESFIKPIVTNNRVLYCHIGVMVSCSANTLIQGNYFNNEGLGQAPQGGYDSYWACVAVSEYSTDERRYGITVSSNSFDGSWAGMIIGSSYVTITGNTFTTVRGIRIKASNLKCINITNNSFSDLLVPSLGSEDWFIRMYNSQYTQIIGNNFISDKGNRVSINGNFGNISNNTFENTTIYASGASTNTTVENNQIYGGIYNTDCIYLNNENCGSIRNNHINLGDDSTHFAIRVYGETSRTDMSYNVVYVTSRSLETIRHENCNRCTFIGNKVHGLSDSQVFIRTYNFRSGIIKENYSDNPKSYVVKATGGFIGIIEYSLNEGIIDGAGGQMNNSTSLFNNQFLEKGDFAIKYNLASNATTMGWVVIGGGYYTTTTWTSGNSYNANAFVKNSSGKVYKVITKGSGNVSEEPSGTTADQFTTADGYTWLYMNNLPTFKTVAISD